MSSQNDIFAQQISKISQLSFARTQNDRELINATLSELNALNYRYPLVSNPTKAILLINQCCGLILPEDTELASKCCQLIRNLAKNQNTIVEGRTLTVAVLWCLQVLRTSKLDLEALTALDALLKGAPSHDLLLELAKSSSLLELAKRKDVSDVTLNALQCLESCTVPEKDFDTDLRICFDIFQNQLVNNLKGDSLNDVKITITCLRGLQNIIKQKPDLLAQNLGNILGIIKSFMLVGLDDFVPPQKLMPSPLTVPEAVPTFREKGGKMNKVRKPKTQPGVMKINDWGEEKLFSSNDDDFSVGNTSRTSDSDFSDTEAGAKARLCVTLGKLRQSALTLLLQTIKLTEKGMMFSYWSSFIPENPLVNKHNLITCILKETTNRGRMVALNALLILLSSSKIFLMQAEKGENLSFTPLSVILGLTIKELHKCLSLALSAISVPVLVMILKCYSALVQATPYHRLSSDLMSKVVRSVKPFVCHKDSTVQVSALIVFGCILASEPSIPETTELLVKNSENDTNSWLLSRCYTNLGYKVGSTEITIPTAVQLESLQIISIMSRNYFDILAPSIEILTEVLNSALSSKYQDVQLHAGRAIDFIGQAINRSTNHNAFVQFWKTLLDGSLTQLLQNSPHPILRAVGCDCLGSIGDFIFEQLARENQILCVTLLFACSRDEDAGVRGAAVRALAISVLYPSLRDDLGFVVDTSETIYRVLHDENFSVKIKSSWALGNLSDALVLYKFHDHPVEEFPQSLLLKLVTVSNVTAKSPDKIKMNVVRALGNFLQLFDDQFMKNADVRNATLEAMEILVTNCASGSNMKVRWNSCYAIGNAMKNSALFALTNWEEKVFKTLMDLVVNFRNLKVRINATVALAAPKERRFYKQWYQPIFMSLVNGLETSDNIQDFREYKHRDNLIEQICLTIGHLLNVITADDLSLIKDAINSDILKSQMGRTWEKLLPEKATILFDARTHLTTLQNSPGLSTEQKQILQDTILILKQAFY